MHGWPVCRRYFPGIVLMALAWPSPAGASSILPTPQYLEPLGHVVFFSADSAAEVVLGPRGSQGDDKMQLAVDFLQQGLAGIRPDLAVKVRTPNERSAGGPTLYLWNFGKDANPPVMLNFLDRETLAADRHFRQSYVVTSPDETSLWVIGSSAQGVLYGVMSVLQLMQAQNGGVAIAGTSIRDYPDFEFRAASDWLLNIEINGWAWDRGQGVEAFARLCEAKLDRALRYKINMVLMDGFGFSPDKRPAYYQPLMLRLNRYARARGMHLVFGGYGASYGMAYELVPMYEQGAAFKGTVFENREHYPDGPLYECMGFPHARAGMNPRTLGSCRANATLNRLKGEELTRFVTSIEPGALYIHHEDFGGFKRTQQTWRDRCPRCRDRWPNDSLAAPDGGAGGLAHGYAELVQAINRVKNPDSGYDAEGDCQILLVSPVYRPDSPTADDWSEVLELWSNIGRQLPRVSNVQAGFREIFPMRHGGERWTERFQAAMALTDSPLKLFMFYIGGADNFKTDYPLSGSPVMNALFRGAAGMYNASGDFYGEPMELINAEYCWNTKSSGFFHVPLTYTEAVDSWHRFMYVKDEPPEIFGAAGLFERACRLLYGQTAGPVMMDYYRESAWLPEDSTDPAESAGHYDSSQASTYVPLTWDRAYAVPFHWRHLLQDSSTWGTEIQDPRYQSLIARMNLSREELHRRLSRRWRIVAELNRRGRAHVDRALNASPLAESVEDLHFLLALLTAYQPLTEALDQFHHVQYLRFSESGSTALMGAGLRTALDAAERARDLARQSFPEPVDPVAGEVGAVRDYSALLAQAIRELLAKLEP